MVRIHATHGEAVTYDGATISSIDQIAPEISRISHLQTMVDRLVLELEPPLELLHGDAKAASLLRALSEAKSYASEDQVVYNKPLSYRVLRNHVQALERDLNSDSEFQKLFAGIEFGWEDSCRLCWALQAMRELRLLSSCGQVTRVQHIYRKWQDPSG